MSTLEVGLFANPIDISCSYSIYQSPGEPRHTILKAHNILTRPFSLLNRAKIQGKSNLARIRENQRRSRARRKEYLHSLEQRLRQCELQGIEASTEIQQAAREVVEENKKLRALLNRYGVGNDNITSYLQTGVVPLPNGSDGPTKSQSNLIGSQTQSLECLLAPRRPSCLDSNISVYIQHDGGERTSRETPTDSVTQTEAALTLTESEAAGNANTLPAAVSHGHQTAQLYGLNGPSMAFGHVSNPLSQYTQRSNPHSMSLQNYVSVNSSSSRPNGNSFNMESKLMFPMTGSGSDALCTSTGVRPSIDFSIHNANATFDDIVDSDR